MSKDKKKNVSRTVLPVPGMNTASATEMTGMVPAMLSEDEIAGMYDEVFGLDIDE